jgi:RNA polymerase sigma factor, sigma-70 family
MSSTLQALDDDNLLERCRSELPYVMDAFSEVVRRHERYVFNLCRRYLGTEADAEDVTQDVFMRVFHALPQFEGRAQFKTWLYRIVMNQCHTVAAKRKQWVHEADLSDQEAGNAFDTLLVDEHTPQVAYSHTEEEDCVQKTLGEMREAESEILNLRFMGELSLEDIANTLGSKLSATKMRFYRAMEQFKKLYEKLCL